MSRPAFASRWHSSPQAQQALFEAKIELELRVVECTRELQEQIVAKDRAHAELEEAQKRLIELSRLSGMAEVATGVLHDVGNTKYSAGKPTTRGRAFSVSESNHDRVVKYIRQQEEHHRKMTFEEELVSFLKKQGIEFDERYLWR